MKYAEFEAEYKRVYEDILNGRGDRDLSADVTRLSALAAQIDDEDEREDAYLEVSIIESAAARGPAEPQSEIVMQAREAYSEAVRDDGTDAERLARAEHGMQELERIAGGGDPDERRAIGSLEHTLMMLIGALRNEAR
ncbi:hypothetical protein [Kribbella sp.]|uniref:hypothetical protein n=1 Tax=Kribbella sp. TaxID=1871183 RepID=UPI002D3E7B6B|nr:hypothetical protein [Kribbella sp.]HZX01988.1 hypothetical protein [Kribbella sp.]